jgi:RNA binding exosome subunit
MNVGANTFPYTSGLVWEPAGYQGNTLTLLSNRAGGVTLHNTSNQFELFLTRKIDNVNMDKGLPNRLDDVMETRLELLINVDTQAGYAGETLVQLKA